MFFLCCLVFCCFSFLENKGSIDFFFQVLSLFFMINHRPDLIQWMKLKFHMNLSHRIILTSILPSNIHVKAKGR